MECPVVRARMSECIEVFDCGLAVAVDLAEKELLDLGVEKAACLYGVKIVLSETACRPPMLQSAAREPMPVPLAGFGLQVELMVFPLARRQQAALIPFRHIVVVPKISFGGHTVSNSLGAPHPLTRQASKS